MAISTPSIWKGRSSALNANLVGTVAPIAGLTVDEAGGPGIARATTLNFAAVAETIADTGAFGTSLLYTFPAGLIHFKWCVASMTFTTTSAIASTLNSGVLVDWGLGSTATADATLATTDIDMLTGSGATPAQFTSSTTINVAPAVDNAYLSAATVPFVLDGTSTAITMNINFGVPTATDIDADATLSMTGTISFGWELMGDY